MFNSFSGGDGERVGEREHGRDQRSSVFCCNIEGAQRPLRGPGLSIRVRRSHYGVKLVHRTLQAQRSNVLSSGRS